MSIIQKPQTFAFAIHLSFLPQYDLQSNFNVASLGKIKHFIVTLASKHKEDILKQLLAKEEINPDELSRLKLYPFAAAHYWTADKMGYQADQKRFGIFITDQGIAALERQKALNIRDHFTFREISQPYDE